MADIPSNNNASLTSTTSQTPDSMNPYDPTSILYNPNLLINRTDYVADGKTVADTGSTAVQGVPDASQTNPVVSLPEEPKKPESVHRQHRHLANNVQKI